MVTDDDEMSWQSFKGACFSAVFQHVGEPSAETWRIRGSGVQDPPAEASTTAAVLAACETLGIKVRSYCMASPANVTSYHIDSRFLGGGISAMTGRYFYGERGAYIRGRKAVLLMAFRMGLRITNRWMQRFNLNGESEATLEAELARQLAAATGCGQGGKP